MAGRLMHVHAEVLQVLGDAMEVGAAVLGVQCKATVKEATE